MYSAGRTRHGEPLCKQGIDESLLPLCLATALHFCTLMLPCTLPKSLLGGQSYKSHLLCVLETF